MIIGEGTNEIQRLIICRNLLERYGDFVLYKPRFKPSTAALWLAPVLLLLVGGLGLARIIRRRAALPVPADDESGATEEV